jgi:endonuclease/exonuclease/phosphatase family metal-dependent hydrolase
VVRLKFVFWNLGKRVQGDLLVDLVESTRADILVLAERSEEDRSLLRALNERGIYWYEQDKTGCERIHVYSSFLPSHFIPRRETGHYSIQQFVAPGYLPILLGMVHLPSKMWQKENDQMIHATYVREAIEELEKKVGHERTLIVGDFNMNPFDAGMFAANAFHSQSCLRTARGKPRVIGERSHSFFYNPTWNLLGDRHGPPGTFFYPGSTYTSLHWNTLDQVILRPVLADRFDNNSLKIVTSAGGRSLLSNKGRPSASDHLPIEFSIDLSRESAHEESVA